MIERWSQDVVDLDIADCDCLDHRSEVRNLFLGSALVAAVQELISFDPTAA